MSATFNVTNISFFDVSNESYSRMNPFEEGGNDRGATNPSNNPLQGLEVL